jgi:CDP-diacylglycerol--glycerol-3-phosphate 3-phosphatidyltransferase
MSDDTSENMSDAPTKQAKRKRFLTIPNALTLFRLVSAPAFLFCWFFFTGEDLRPVGLWICLVLACLSEASDLLDGQTARWLHQVSDFGKLMDPYADSIFRLTVFFCFASTVDGEPWFPLWMPVLFMLRDIGTSVVRTFAMQQKIVVAAKASGKIKAIAQGFVMIALLVLAVVRGKFGIKAQDFHRDAFWMMAIVLAVGYWGLIEHLWAHISVFRKSATGE